MSNWAIVIGVDRYDPGILPLREAVNDARRVHKWLLSPSGGNVPPKQMRLLLSPHAPSGDMTDALPADRKSVIRAINDVLQQSAGRGQRLYFYFAGHGMSARVELANLSAILPSDFQIDIPDISISLDSLFDHCKSTQFAEQYFLFDACRDIVFGQQEVRMGHIPLPQKQITPPPPQYVMYATQSGAKANEVLTPGSAGGAFTRSLIAGLGGAGAAKLWNDRTSQYEVRWSTLFNYVRAEVARRKLSAGDGTSGPLTQEPRRYGENAGEDPILARLSPTLVNKETMKISVQPPALVGGATLQVRDLDADHRAGPPLVSPHVLDLLPRTYRVSAMVPGYQEGSKVIDLYEPLDLTLELRPAGPTDPSLLGQDVPIVTRGIGAVLQSTGDVGATHRTPLSSVPLIVDSNDSLARLELTSASGALIAGRRGRVSSEVAPGFYRVRIVSPEGDFFEKPIEVSGFESPVMVRAEIPAAASPAMNALVQLGKFRSNPDGTVDVSEAIGDAAFMQPSTVLALAAAAKIETDTSRGYRLRELALPSFRELTGNAANGAMVLFGDESTRGDFWKQTTVRFIPQLSRSPIHERPALPTEVPGVFASTHELPANPHWLEIQVNDARSFSMPIHVLPDHVALVVLMKAPDKDVDVHLYQVQVRPDGTRKGYDPNYNSARFAAIRRIELMQRTLANGRVTPIVPDLEQMLMLEWLDPVAASLGCYALIRLGRWKDVQRLAGALQQRFPQLPDPWIASACYADHVGDKTAREECKRAFEAGCSSFRDGVALLRRLLRSEGADRQADRLDKLADRMLPDSLWALSPASLAFAWAESAFMPSRTEARSTARTQGMTGSE